MYQANCTSDDLPFQPYKEIVFWFLYYPYFPIGAVKLQGQNNYDSLFKRSKANQCQILIQLLQMQNQNPKGSHYLLLAILSRSVLLKLWGCSISRVSLFCSWWRGLFRQWKSLCILKWKKGESPFLVVLAKRENLNKEHYLWYFTLNWTLKFATSWYSKKTENYIHAGEKGLQLIYYSFIT